jgi:23S rRNA pseudouridine1911/1915/1917 synthase
VTHVKNLNTQEFGKAKVSLVMCRLETGRTHQIRVHLESLGNPLLGDPVYKKKSPADAAQLVFSRPGQALHATVLGIKHPSTKEDILWQAPIPQDMHDLGIRLGMTEKDLHPVWDELDD